MGCRLSTDKDRTSTEKSSRSRTATTFTQGRATSCTLKQSTANATQTYPIRGSPSIMRKKRHGTSDTPVQSNLRWSCDYRTADRICNYNRHYAEHSGYFTERRQFLKECERAKQQQGKTLKFYDSNTGNLLFEAPVRRSWEEFLRESRAHGWPSFRDAEVNWEHVRCLRGGEAVSLAGTHLGHNLPDHKGNRYCINLVSVAGRPTKSTTEKQQQQTEESPEGTSASASGSESDHP